MIDIATRLGERYRIDARIGGGGMADVFEARDEALDRDVAIKLLRGIDDEAAARRFAEEIRLTARLNHPNVVRLFDAGEHEGSPYLVLERVTGGTLAARMADGPLAPEQVAEIGRQIAAALEHAHGQGIVHRDVKPSNVLLSADGGVRLADFGIALTATATRLTVAGSVAGSAGYVSPEQVLGTGAGASSDVYALGLVLLECLTGEPPWTGTTVEVALARITADPPIPDTLDEGWQGLLLAMTARRPEDRPSMGLVAEALEDLEAGRASPLFPLPAPAPRRRDLRAPVAVAAVALLAAAGLAVTLWRGPATPSVATMNTMDAAITASVLRGAAVTPAPTAAPAAATAGDAQPDRTRTTRPAPRRERDRTGTTAPTGTGGDRTAGTTGTVAQPRTSGPSSGSSTTTNQQTTRDTSPTTDTTDDAPATGDTADEPTATATKGKGKSRRDEVRPGKVGIPKIDDVAGPRSGE